MKWKLKLEAGEQLVGTVVIHDDQNDRVTAAEKGFEIGEKCHEQEQINKYNNEAAAAETPLPHDLGDYSDLNDQSDDRLTETERGRELVDKCKEQQELPDHGDYSCNP